MKQLAATVAILIAVIAGISWATSRSSSAQEEETPTETTVPEEDAPAPSEDLRSSLDEFVDCLRDQGIEVPDFEEGEGSFGFHFDFDTEDFEGLQDAHDACGDDLVLPFKDFQFGEGLLFGDGPFGEFPFDGRFGDGFGSFGFGGAFDLDQLAECLSELGTFENVDEVKAQLEECLPASGGFDPDDFESFFQDRGEFPFEGRGGFGFFGGPEGFSFDFDFDGDFGFDNPDVEEPALEGASV